LTTITGLDWDADRFIEAGERVYTLEKMFNYREGFRREDDQVPERFFTEPLTVGDEEGAVLNKDEFNIMMDEYYAERNWDIETTRPSNEKINQLGLSFTM